MLGMLTFSSFVLWTVGGSCVLIATLTPKKDLILRGFLHLLVDGSLVEVQIIEEWGYELGDDACLLEDDTVSKESLAGDEVYRCDP
jgi:hypothetical protein